MRRLTERELLAIRDLCDGIWPLRLMPHGQLQVRCMIDELRALRTKVKAAKPKPKKKLKP